MIVQRLSFEHYFAGLIPAQTKNRLHDFTSSRAYETGNAQYFTPAHIKGYILKYTFTAQPLHFQYFLTQREFHLREQFRKLAANHHRYQPLFIHIADIAGANGAAVAHTGNAIRQRKNIFHSMGDKDDAHAIGFEFGNRSIKRFHFVVGQRRSRLIHDNNRSIARNRLDDFHHLHFRKAQLAHARRRAALHAEFVQQLLRFQIRPALIQKNATLAKFAVQKNVIRNTEIQKRIQFLIDHGNAARIRILLIVNFYFLSINQNIA